MNSNKLAILIPAYKSDYFEQTLSSIAAQTDRRFNVYIGNDCGDKNIESIVVKYKNTLNITYRYFENNLGRKNLIAHWDRVVQMMQNEQYFMFFSDDDFMDPTCVESFYNALKSTDALNVYHFNIRIVDYKGNIIATPNPFPNVISAERFFYDVLMRHRSEARMPEFIFRKNNFMTNGGFVEFPMAMRSDNATVMLNSRIGGIQTIQGAYVYWRQSNKSISSIINQSREKISRMLLVDIQYYNWLHDTFGHSVGLNARIIATLKIIKKLITSKTNFTFIEKIRLFKTLKLL